MNILKINILHISGLLILSLLILATILFTTKIHAQGKPDFPGQIALNYINVCPGPINEGNARCHAKVVTDEKGSPNAVSTPSGYGPKQFLGAYNLSPIASSSPIIAIVDAYNHPNIKSDLDKYNSTFGLSYFPTCSGPIADSLSPCFQKVDQRGGSLYPRTDSGWALEIALDVEVAHAICQNCRLLLVEADSNSYDNLMAAFDQARLLGANVISNSYGSNEFSSETSFDSHFNYPGLAITFSSGDSGYGVSFPAASQYVTAVGGTTLNVSSNDDGMYSWGSESVWSGSGSGCSAYESKPGWQTDTGCPTRTVADVSADANPNTGAAVYNSVRYLGKKGWFKVGGTSLSAPLVAGVYALAGGVPGGVYGNSLPYLQGNSTNLYDILTGSNGSCGGGYLCTGIPGYDGPTGLGSPNGIGAF